MSGYVIDASAAVEYLTRSAVGLSIAELTEGVPINAPDIIDAEILAALRSMVLRGDIHESQALAAVDRIRSWSVNRIPSGDLLRPAWRHYRNVSAYDALYVATARMLGVPLITSDERLTRVPGLGIQFVVVAQSNNR